MRSDFMNKLKTILLLGILTIVVGLISWGMENEPSYQTAQAYTGHLFARQRQPPLLLRVQDHLLRRLLVLPEFNGNHSKLM